MSAQPDPMVAAVSAPYRQPAPIPPEPPPPPPAPQPPSLDHLLDERLVICPRWAWKLTRAFYSLAAIGLVAMVVGGFADSAEAGLGALAFATLGLPVGYFNLGCVARSMVAEPAGLRVVWGNGEAGFYPWRSLKPWTTFDVIRRRWALDFQGGFGEPIITGPASFTRLCRVGRLLAQAHAAERDAREKGQAR